MPPAPIASSSKRTPPKPDQPSADELRCLGRRLATLLLRQQLVDLAIGAHCLVEGFVNRLDLLAQELLGLGDHAAQILSRARARLATRIADPLHSVGFGKITGRGRRAGLAIGLAVDLEQCAAGLFDLVLILVEALGEPNTALQQRIILAAPDREVTRGLVHGFGGILANIPETFD